MGKLKIKSFPILKLDSTGIPMDQGGSKSLGHYLNFKGKQAEQIISDLAENTFFADWCYRNPKLPDGKELCDLLVVFDDTMIVVQIKNTKLGKDGGFKQKHFEKNADQILGAYRQLMTLKTAIKLENQRRPEETFDPQVIMKVFFLSAMVGDRPDFMTVDYMHKGQRIHVFDSENLEVILRELDTISDFCKYLDEKEAAFKERKDKIGNILILGGEKELLALYMKSGRSFKSLVAPDVVVLEDGNWEEYLKIPEVVEKRKLDSISGLWDYLIERCHVSAEPQYEVIAREMARLNRFKRRILSDSYKEAHDKSQVLKNHQRSIRYIPIDNELYVFLFATQDTLRKDRKEVLEAACMVAQIKYKIPKVLGIASEVEMGNGRSFDYFFATYNQITREMEDYAEQLSEKWDILKSPTQTPKSYDEFPKRK